jgi:hypothetical protein
MYLPYLLLTLVLEVPLVLAIFWRRSGWQRALAVAFGASLVTHPLLHFVWPLVISKADHYWLYVATGEVLVTLVEAAIFFAVAFPPREDDRETVPMRMGLALVASLVVNFVSWGAGTLLYYAELLHLITLPLSRTIYWLLGGSD